MKKLALLFAATAFALSGGALAATADGIQPSEESAKPAPDSAAKRPHGFVVLQRNIYVPVDADGKVSSENWIVVEQQGFVSAEEVDTTHAQKGMDAPAGQPKEGSGEAENAERAPKLEQPGQLPHAVPSHRSGLPPIRGPFIAS